MAPENYIFSERLELCNRAPINQEGKYVFYWMNAFHRPCWNFSLDRAVQWAKELKKPLLIVETLSSGGRWASDRHHAFVIQGMAQNAKYFKRAEIPYYPYVEQTARTARRLVKALAEFAAVVVTDDFPIRSYSEEVDAVAKMIKVRVEKVDSNGLLPVRAAKQAYPSAFTFRRFLQKALPDYLPAAPSANPFSRCKLPRFRGLRNEVRKRWPAVSARLLRGDRSQLASLPIAHDVAAAKIAGGWQAARARLRKFLKHGLPRYHQDRNEPELDATSGLSAYLHFGQISVYEILQEVARWAGWSPEKMSGKVTGKSLGWWGMPEPTESFLDELITWRELAFNICAKRQDYDQYDSLPDWAQKTLARHAKDKRQYVYSLAEFEQGRTHDPLWNSAQMQLVREGRMHNYLRMLWGKKILQWTSSPRKALEVMIELNNKYALDGQDPNSYSGIFWVLGRYDRPWGPERKIFGTIRYMSSENTRRKISVKNYIHKYARPEKGKRP